jgi:periplasmic protein TonB
VSREFQKAALSAAFYFSSANDLQPCAGVFSSKKHPLEGAMVQSSGFDRDILAGTIEASWRERARRGSTLLTSFGLQAAVVMVLLVLPLFHPASFPSFHQLSTPINLGAPVSQAPAVRLHAGSAAISIIPAENSLRVPAHIPSDAAASMDDQPPVITGLGSEEVLGSGSGDLRGMPNVFGSGSRPVVPPPPTVQTVHTVRISHMSEGDLIRRVQPAYPALARAARIQGIVVLQATISKEGTIKNLRVLNGHPMLAQAAIDAVRQWRYRPYILNNEPVEVETQVTVNFSLAGS